MAITREEATVVLNADIGTIERNLGIGKSYFDRWGKQLKSDQEKYTEWWGQELKKREEMEVAASVRAAQRSNLARKLRRQRTEATAERISEELGKGSIPESWKQVTEAGRNSAHEIEGEFSHARGHINREMREAAKEIKKSFGSQLGEVASGLKGLMTGSAVILGFVAVEAWKKFTEWFANQAFGNDSPINEYLAKTLDARREYFRKEREERDKAREANAKATEEAKQQAKEQEDLNEQVTDVIVRQNIIKEGADSPEGRQGEKARLQMNIDNRQLDLDRAKMAKDRLASTKAELALEAAKLEMLQFQTEENRRQAEQKKIQAEADRERKQISQEELNKFMPTLQELEHRGIFGRQARRIGRLERNIRRDFEFGHVDAAKRDLAERDKIYDSLAAKGILPEREEKKRLEDLQRRTAESIEEIANGKKVIKTQVKLT